MGVQKISYCRVTLFEEEINQCMATDSKVFNICCDISHWLPKCVICLKSGEGLIFFHTSDNKNINKHGQQRQRPERGQKNIHCCNEDGDQRRTHKPHLL